MIVPHRIEGVRVPQLIVTDTLIDGLWALARAARARFGGEVIGADRQRRQDQHQGIRCARLSRCLCAAPGSFNNFWGVPLTLCNADPSASAVGGRDGHEPDRRNLAPERI